MAVYVAESVVASRVFQAQRPEPKREPLRFYGPDAVIASRTLAQWRTDESVSVRCFPRTVRVDGLYLKCTAVIVRRKVAQ